MDEQKSRAKFLTSGDKGQRAYLSGDYKPETNNAEYQVRAKIRSRIEGALSEFKFISDNISDRDLEKIFENWESDANKYPEDVGSKGEHYRIKYPQQLGELQAIIGMAYRGYRLNGMDADEFVNSVVENAIRQAEAERNDVHANKNISIDLELQELEVHTDPDKLDPLEKYKKELGLTKDEQQELLNRLSDKVDGDISLPEVTDLIDKHLVEPDGE